MLNTTTDLKSVGQPEYTDTVTSTSLQNKHRAPSHLTVSEVENIESERAQRAFFMTGFIRTMKSSERRRAVTPPYLRLIYSAASRRGKQG